MSVRIGDHPVHAALVHFPIALLLSTVLWDGVALTIEPAFWRFGFWVEALGLVAAAASAVVGFVDFVGLPERAEATGWRHLVSASVGVVLFGAALLLRERLVADALGGVVLAIEVVGAGAIALAGWFGAALVFTHDVGRDETRQRL